MANDDRPAGSLTGLTPEAAKEFHRIFMVSFILFTLVAIVAHFLVWSWRPWFPTVNGYAELEGVARAAASMLTANA